MRGGRGRAADGIPGCRIVSAGAARHPGMPCALAASQRFSRLTVDELRMPITRVGLFKLAVKRLPRNLFLYLSLSSGNLSRKIEVSNGNTLIER